MNISESSILRFFGTGKICNKNELPCGWLFKTKCYNPLTEVCKKGRVDCGFGFRRCGSSCIQVGEGCCKNEEKCGKNCYNPEAGETCTSSGNICRSGHDACGKFCYNPNTQNCWAGDLICNLGEEPCFGITCYSTARDQTCFRGGLVCKTGEVPDSEGRCMKILFPFK